MYFVGWLAFCCLFCGGVSFKTVHGNLDVRLANHPAPSAEILHLPHPSRRRRRFMRAPAAITAAERGEH